MAIAPLGFQVDTSQVVKGKGDLDNLTAATTKADAAVKSLGTDSKAAAAGVAQIGAASDTAAAGIARVAANTNQAQQQMRNLSFQFQDIGTMLAAGQSPFMLLAQQLPQITMYGGKLTGVGAALKQTLSGLLSPLGLVTTGFVIAASAAISYFGDSGKEAEKLAEELEKQEDMIARVAERWDDAVPAIQDYANEIERLIDLSDLGKATDLTITKQYEDAGKALDDFLNALQESEAATTLNNDAGLEYIATILELKEASAELAAAQLEGVDTTELMARVQTLVNSVMGNGQVAAAGLGAQVVQLGNDYMYAAGQAQAAAAAFALLSSRGGVPLNDKAGAGRGGDPRGSFEDEGGYWEDRMFPDPETPARAPRKARGGGGAGKAARAAEKATNNYAEMIRDSKQFIEQQHLEAEALFQTEEAAAALKYEQELLNEAANDNIKLTPQMTAELQALAQQMAEAESSTDALKEQFNLVKDVAKGFITDFIDGVREGKDVWEAFSEAALNALNKITDKLVDMATDALISNLLGGLVGGGGAFGTSGGFADMLGMAQGGVFSGGNVVPFARGGVVTGPTLFPFAKGTGLMGEAGPESIMPLRRDSQGNLGVISSGGRGGDTEVYVTVNNAPPGTKVNETKRSDGRNEIREYVVEIVNETIANGDADQSMRGRTGVQPRKVVRG